MEKSSEKSPTWHVLKSKPRDAEADRRHGVETITAQDVPF